MALNTQPMMPWATGWNELPDKLPGVRRCPVCGSIPVWRHNMNCYWLFCCRCGLETPAFRDPREVSLMWNKGSEERETGATNLPDDSDEAILDAAERMKP